MGFIISTERLTVLALFWLVLFPSVLHAETYGIKDVHGNFIPKVTVTIGQKEIVIKKTVPDEKFKTIALRLNPKNTDLIERVAELSIEWLDSRNRPNKPVPFAGSLYDRGKKEFRDSMTRSTGLRIVDKSRKNLFAHKLLPDLFTIYVDDEQLLSAESVRESDTVRLGPGKDVSINVDKTVIMFSEANLLKGEWVTVENRTGLEQVLGLEIPRFGWEYYSVIRKPEQSKLAPEHWDQFNVAAGAGVAIALVPDRDISRLNQLHGKEIIVKLYQGGKPREIRRIPIQLAADLQKQDVADPSVTSPHQPASFTNSGRDHTHQAAEIPPRDLQSQVPSRGVKGNDRGSLWLWVVQVLNLALLLGFAAYMFFMVLPRVQVLEDRMSKSEMFILGSREAIREELEHMKKEICSHIQQGPSEKESG